MCLICVSTIGIASLLAPAHVTTGVPVQTPIQITTVVKQNEVQKVELETISTQKNIPEDVQNIISGFAANQIKGGRKSKRRGVNKKRKSTKKYRNKLRTF